MALDRRGRHLYTIESGTHTIGVARVRADGSLEVLSDVAGLRDAAAGIAAFRVGEVGPRSPSPRARPAVHAPDKGGPIL